MTPRTKKITAAVGSAAVLASAAYGLGTQAGDGAASADSAGQGTTRDHTMAAPGPMRREFGLGRLASRLGVDKAALRKALDEIRAERPEGAGPGGPAKNLADALGVPVEKVRSALKTLRQDHRAQRGDRRDGFLAAVAKSLGVSEDKVSSALEKLGPGHGPPPGPPTDRPARLAAAAKELGVSEAKLRAALRDARPDFGPGGRPGKSGGPGHAGPGGPLAADLAKALGLSADKVQAALAKQGEARRDEFAKKLADKLGIPEAKVKAALPARPLGPPFGHHGPRGGHGMPGGPPPGDPGDPGGPGGPPPGP